MSLFSSISTLHILHQAGFGALAAIGFGILFNFGARSLAFCGAMGALALAIRTVGQSLGWSLEAASFLAALVTACFVLIFLRKLGAAGRAIALAGCIPMVPGAFFNQALLGFLALSAPESANAGTMIIVSVQAMLRVVFTLGAIGAGLTIPSHLARDRGF